MTQPSDPVAYLRFTEGLSAGIPDYDSGNVMTEENYREEIEHLRPINPPRQRTPEPTTPANAPEAAPASVSETNPNTASDSFFTPAATSAESTRPRSTTGTDTPIFLEPEWGGGGSPRNIVDLPPVRIAEEPAAEEPLAEEVAAEDDAEDTVDGEYLAEDDEYDSDEYLAEDEGLEEDAEEIAAEEELGEEPVEVAAEEETAEEEYIAEEEPAAEEEYIAAGEPAGEPEEEVVVASAPREFIIVPAEERPPSTLDGIDPSDIIPGIAYNPPPPPEPVITPRPAEPTFSDRRIYSLDRGSFYVQVAAFDSPEAVEDILNGIDRNYKPKVYKDGDRWYRVLLGPLNQGESAAILQRFRSIGYKDAFVRQVR
jgi:hypothetical protein